MGHKVFANNMEVGAKASSGKSICAFPDVCMTPPENPATPPGVPIPYPNTGMASDMTGGSTSTKIKSKPVLLRNKSYMKKSIGNEGGVRCEEGHRHQRQPGQGVFRVVVDGREGRRAERGSPPRHDDA